MSSQQDCLALADWRVVETRPVVDENPVRETVFSLANGYLGLRGSHEERHSALGDKSADAAYINGFYDCIPVNYAESGYAWPREQQFMLPVPDGKGVSFSFEGEQFDLFNGAISSYERALDFRSGTLLRHLVWRSASGAELVVSSRRIVCLARKNLYALEYEITAKNKGGRLVLTSSLDSQYGAGNGVEQERYGPSVSGGAAESPLLLASRQTETASFMLHETKGSRFAVASAVENVVVVSDGGKIEHASRSKAEGEHLENSFSLDLKAGESVRLTKYGVYFTSKEPQPAKSENRHGELLAESERELKESVRVGFATLLDEQREFLERFFHRAAISIEGSDAEHIQSLRQGVVFSQFHLLQSVGRDGHTSMAAKGLTGDGYGGHYFWDAETYAFPFFLYTEPKIARSLLEFRYGILDKARQRARELGHERGALFAWRTIGGEESSTYFPAGTAAYHINADIAYAVKQYYEATGDEQFLCDGGAEILFETARIWLGIGNYTGDNDSRFNLNEVTGPDEYTAMVNNNFYTNAMAKDHLRFAGQVAALLAAKHPARYEKLVAAIGLDAGELAEFEKAARCMYLPYDDRLGVHAQDDGFLEKKKWDLAATPAEKFPLARFYHYLVIYRHQVLKQADVVLALFLLGDQFDRQVKKRDFDYYEAITTHDSSLSRCTYAIVAAEVGYRDKAYRYFVERLRGDLDNQYSDCSHGVHIAAMAGNWMAIVNGFGGMRVYDGRLHFNPWLPEKWSRYSFRVTFGGALVEVAVDQDAVLYRLLEGEHLTIVHGPHGGQAPDAQDGDSGDLGADGQSTIELSASREIRVPVKAVSSDQHTVRSRR